MDGPDTDAGAGAGDQRLAQLGLLAVCLVGLLVAAFAAPQLAPDVGVGAGGDGSAGGGAGVGEVLDAVAGNESDEADEGEAVDPDRAAPAAASDCTVDVSGPLEPGATVTVLVLVDGPSTPDGEPVSGATVYFGDRRVGETGADGELDATVPYRRDLVVTAALPPGTDCGGSGGTDAVQRTPGERGAFAPARASALARPGAPAQEDDPGAGGNVTESYRVDGAVNVTVDGRPLPGSNVTVRATVAGRPVPEAAVTADGSRVGTTDATGAVTYRVPDDGTESVRLAARRGEFVGRYNLTVALLTARVQPRTPLPVPTGAAVVDADLGDGPAADAAVTVGGRRVGTTDGAGRLRLSLPVNPLASVTVERGSQSVTRPLAPLYAPTVVAAVLALLCVAVLGTVLVAGAGVGAAGVGWFVGAVLRAVTRLDETLARLGGVVGRLAAALRAAGTRLQTALGRGLAGVPALLWAPLAWFASLPGAVLDALRRVAAAVASVPRSLADWVRGLRATGGDAEAAEAARGTPAAAGTDPTTLRERWRAFARRVAPERWRQRTPGEVARRAVDAGFPREAVRDLTGAFRDVEYGGASLPTDRRERVREAYDRLASHGEATAAAGVGDTQAAAVDEGDEDRGGDGP